MIPMAVDSGRMSRSTFIVAHPPSLSIPRSPRYRSLDLWRVAACLLVVVFHSTFYSMAGDNGEFGGAPLRGTYFRSKWGNGSVANLYAYTKNRMPPDRPGALSDKVYTDLVAYLLQVNGYESGGRELPADPKVQQSMSLKRD